MKIPVSGYSLVISIFYCGLHKLIICYETSYKGPSFLIEPPTKLEFSNSSGAWLDCTATGNPAPTIEWVSMDGMPLMDIPGVRRTVRNGTLILYPFSAGGFRQDIHSAIYRCIASNSVGRIISRDVQIRAVVVQAYKVDVVVLGAARGCTAILQCVIPSFVKDLVRVISWVQEPSFHIYPSLQGDGKFHVLPTGELLVSNLDFSDQFPTYKCRTMHRLTRQVAVSAPANVRINDHRSLVPPTIVGLTATVLVGQDEGAVMVCLAQACPHSEYRWYRTDHNLEPLLVLPGPRTRVLGPILAIEGVTGEDSGTYRCSSSNIGGEATAEVRLQVSTPYRVEVNPPLLSVHLDGSATFQCDIAPYDSGPYLIAWFKDGRQIPGRSSSSSLVINPVGREDKGIYQCIVRRNDGDTAQGAAELQLGDTPPILTYSFIEQTLQPGPAVSLKCIASGNPTPDVAWSLDGFELPANNRFVIGQFVSGHGDVISHVNISHVTVEDGGEYSCIAENRAGKATHSARLNIYGLPYVRLIPKVTAIAGESLSIKCPVAGYPIEEIHWEKGGRELPDGIRQKIQPGGVLTISPVQKESDTGVYTCWARNKQGHSARRSGEVVVIVPPKLSPVSPERTLNVGERASLICSVTKGDIPLTIKWLKDGRYLDSSAALSITHVDQFNSMLVIDSVSARHSGNYSCTVRNMAAEETQIQRLIVNVPPRWIVEPSDVHEERNRAVMLNCQAEGVPEPTVVWKKAKDGKSGDYEEIIERSYTKLLANGSLFLQNIKEDREGYYLCQASNGIGNPIGKLVQVKVNSPPYFSAPSHIVTVKKGDTAKLQCTVSGDLPIQIQWIRAGASLDLNSPNGYRLSMKQESTSDDGVRAELTISGTEPGDGGAYFCQASNMYGKDQQLVQLLVQEPPESPSDLKTVLVTSRAINIQWHHASVNSAEVSHFIVQHKSGNDGSWKQVELNGQLRGCLLEDLKPATRYLIRVFAEGRAGRSVPSETLVVITEPQQPAGPPLNIVARPASSSQLLVTWSPPVQELRNGDIQGYNLGFMETSSSSGVGTGSYNMTGLVGDGAEEGAEFLLTDLAKFTRYSVVVQAVNQVGPGPMSEPVTAQTLEDVPSLPPEDIRCGAASSHSLQVSWKPPPVSHCNGILQGYKLQYDSQDEAFDDFESKKTSSLTLLLPNLHKFTNYSIQVLAMTRVGEGVYSQPIYCQTSEDAPGSPEDIKVVVSSPQSLLVTWLPPKEPNGVITKYNLYTRTMTGREELAHKKTSLMSQHLSHEVKNLNEHVEYQFWITATTRVGEGQSSKVISQIPTSRVPAKISSFGGLIRRPWHSSVSFPCLMVGQPPPRRTWLRGDSVVMGGGGGGRNLQMGEGGELTIGNLQASDSDNYTCLVENNVGSDKITYMLLVQVVPSTPVLYVASAIFSHIVCCHYSGSQHSCTVCSKCYE
uniref:Down syndrome cell adhesion molecule-like protein Dscam2 n=1 Tax=Cacopsylla melanoneura TaxID=428564 RepID=A0A8D9ERR1_9HEMI